MVNYIFGVITNVNEGDQFKDRAALRAAGLHLNLQKGIDGNQHVGSPSIVLSGGYIDDYDLGDEILYTGHGGNDPSSKRQIADQNWDSSGNKALVVSELHGLPVRVIRGAKHKSPFSPKAGYEYGGLYYVNNHFEEIGKDGYKICRYRLTKDNAMFKDIEGDSSDYSEGKEEPKRLETTVLRIVRDSKLSKQIKALYNYTCQICDLSIAVNGVGYAEGAHIRPLGKPHNGKDKSDNLLCLCPNHHVMLDIGTFTIADDYTLVGIEGKIKVDKRHVLDKENFRYHREHRITNQK